MTPSGPYQTAKSAILTARESKDARDVGRFIVTYSMLLKHFTILYSPALLTYDDVVDSIHVFNSERKTWAVEYARIPEA